MFRKFGPKSEGVTKQTFSTVMRDILMGLGDGLEREPIAFSLLDGNKLEQWAQSPEFEIEAISAFGALDAHLSCQLKAGAIKKAMRRIFVDQDTSLQKAGVNVEQDLDQIQFVDVYRKVVFALVKFLKGKPLSVAHSEKVFDGASISQLIKENQALDYKLDKNLESHSFPCDPQLMLPKSNLRSRTGFKIKNHTLFPTQI